MDNLVQVIIEDVVTCFLEHSVVLSYHVSCRNSYRFTFIGRVNKDVCQKFKKITIFQH